MAKATWEKNNTLNEKYISNILFREKDISELYDGLESFISTENLCMELAYGIYNEDKNKLREILKHIAEMYGY